MEEAGEIIAWYTAPKQQIEVRVRTLSADEPCICLGEFIRPSLSGKSRVRYQMLRVVRGDRVVTAFVYLGPAKKFAADQFQIPGGEVDDRTGRGRVWHTVGELRDIAERIRSDPPRREVEPSDLQVTWNGFTEEMGRIFQHRSTFGAGVHLQRD